MTIRLNRWHAIALCGAIAAFAPLRSTACAQGTARQFWPELDLYWNVDSRHRVFVMASSRYQSRANGQIATGIHLDYLGMSNGFARTGYRYLFSIDEAGRREHRGLLEATLHSGGSGARFVNRGRLELRDIHGEVSMRLRERVRLEQAFHASGGTTLRPYVSTELFYDSRYHALARLRSLAGAEVAPKGRVHLDVGYARQDDWRGSSPAVNAFSFKLSLAY